MLQPFKSRTVSFFIGKCNSKFLYKQKIQKFLRALRILISNILNNLVLCLFEADFTPFVIRLEQYVGEFQRRYSELSSDPKRLLAKNEYRSAVISASILLEAELREKFRYRMEGYTRPLGLKNLLDLARDKGYSDFDTYASIREFISVRNQLIHTNKNIPQKQALTIVVKIEKVLKDIASAMESEYYQVKIDDPDRD